MLFLFPQQDLITELLVVTLPIQHSSGFIGTFR
jgi:hypothetical protein